MKSSILNNIQTENTWLDVETVAKLKGVTKRAIRLSIQKYEYKVKNIRGGKTYKIKLSSLLRQIIKIKIQEQMCPFLT